MEGKVKCILQKTKKHQAKNIKQKTSYKDGGVVMVKHLEANDYFEIGKFLKENSALI